MREFLEMGGYAAYVWPAYGAALATMLGLLAASLASARARRRELAALEGRGRTRRPRRPGAAAAEDGHDAEAP